MLEAGLVIAQRWAERERCILIIVPANLRKQWHQELQDKFSLQALILEARNYRQLRRDGQKKPFEQRGQIIICSYRFAKSKAGDWQQVPWDLVVMDEIEVSFQQLQPDLSGEINAAMLKTRQTESTRSRNCFERALMDLTRAEFDDAGFHLSPTPAGLPGNEVPAGRCELPRHSGEAHLYRTGHPLARAQIERGNGRSLPREPEDSRNRQRRKIFDRQDEIDGQRSGLIEALEGSCPTKLALAPCLRFNGN